ncbi:hypothetical protein [Marinobacter similis]|uniref:hypothetical protein n=1 Tax=Marinobacter similis TaxID=1420916 RepID=UPI001F448EA1|nr:hypothetical protein [Marinobacter similis]
MSLRQLCVFFTLIWATLGTANANPEKTATSDDWTQVVRSSPYWVSQGVYSNVLTIRGWVLKETGYCANADRHILFDMRGQFLAGSAMALIVTKPRPGLTTPGRRCSMITAPIPGCLAKQARPATPSPWPATSHT